MKKFYIRKRKKNCFPNFTLVRPSYISFSMTYREILRVSIIIDCYINYPGYIIKLPFLCLVAYSFIHF